jgi:hypothetical protein
VIRSHETRSAYDRLNGHLEAIRISRSDRFGKLAIVITFTNRSLQIGGNLTRKNKSLNKKA